MTPLAAPCHLETFCHGSLGEAEAMSGWGRGRAGGFASASRHAERRCERSLLAGQDQPIAARDDHRGRPEEAGRVRRAGEGHANLYDALDQLLTRKNFDSAIPYTRWKAYIYVNAGNTWPQTTWNDTSALDTLMAKRQAEQLASSHWAAWKAQLKAAAKVDASIWLGRQGMIRRNYTLQ